MHLIIETIALRPYVFMFLGTFLIVSAVNYGWRVTIAFTILSYAVALGCEWSSVHYGFPFGLYHYLPATRGRELWVAGVPFMDSISFAFLAFTSYTVALLLAAPIYRNGWDVRILDAWRTRGAVRVWLMAALLMVMVDLVADPLSVRGDRWFLGKLFWYDPPGPYFGVPISNFVGWFIVAGAAIAIFQLIDRRLNRGRGRPNGMIPGLPSRALLGPLLYAGIVGFGITMLFKIGAQTAAWASIFIFIPLVALAIHTVTRRENQGDAGAIAWHLDDFPFEADLRVWPQQPGAARKEAPRRRA
jgi:uncharacterized membrane protein